MRSALVALLFVLAQAAPGLHAALEGNHEPVHACCPDGPFAETKEQIGGFFLFEAASFQEALDVAARWPSARLGSIEVRPVEEGLRMDRRYGPTD